MKTVTILTCERTPSYLANTVSTIPKDYDIQYIIQGEVEVPRAGEIVHTEKPYASDSNRHRDASYNYAQALLYTKEGLVVEDDVMFSSLFDFYIDDIIEAIPTERYAVALYSCYDWSDKHLYNGILTDYPVHDFYGTQAVLFDIETAREFGNYLLQNIGRELWDFALKRFILEINPQVRLYASKNSMIQHIGNTSSISTDGHQAFNFIGNQDVDTIKKTGYWTKDTDTMYHMHSPTLSNWIVDFLKDHENTQIYDFGCGLGDYLKALEDNGFKKLKGIEVDPMDKNHKFKILKADLTEPLNLKKKGIIICLEVGEHIPARYESAFLDNLVNNCDKYLILSWAVRGQGGYGHFNELDNYEVIGRLVSLGFNFLSEVTLEARAYLESYHVPGDKAFFFRNTLLIFEKNNTDGIS
jgi:SAM-dependent methyltransferase